MKRHSGPLAQRRVCDVTVEAGVWQLVETPGTTANGRDRPTVAAGRMPACSCETGGCSCSCAPHWGDSIAAYPRTTVNRGRSPRPRAWSAPRLPYPSAASQPPGICWPIWNRNPATQAANNTNRNPLTAAISQDEGETWGHLRNLEDAPDDAWAYPAVTWIDDRALVTNFTYSGGHSLKLKSLPWRWFYCEVG